MASGGNNSSFRPQVSTNGAQATGIQYSANTRRLLGITPAGEKIDYLKIVNFVSIFDSKDEEKILLPDGSSFTPKGAKTKPSVESVSPLQYMEAASKILIVLLNKGDLTLAQVPEYLGYMVKVSQLGQKYMWASVMAYDDMYGKAQAVDKFGWDEDVSHARDVTLRPRETKPSSSSSDKDTKSKSNFGDRKSNQKNQKRSQQRSGQERASICNAYNNGQPCPRSPCTYKHFCMTCGSSSHNRLFHSTGSGVTNSGGAAGHSN